MKNNLFLSNIAVLILSALVFVTIYAVGQQTLRSSANDPQLQIARDAALQSTPSHYLSSTASGFTVDIEKSLAAYYMFYDSSAKLIDTNAQVNGKAPSLPSGVLDAAKKSGENVVTWQPEKNVRSAIVVEAVRNGDGGYVVVGRSLAQVEKREDLIGYISLAGFGISVILLALVHFSRRLIES